VRKNTRGDKSVWSNTKILPEGTRSKQEKIESMMLGSKEINKTKKEGKTELLIGGKGQFMFFLRVVATRLGKTLFQEIT
jgi:hypothetical protein